MKKRYTKIACRTCNSVKPRSEMRLTPEGWVKDRVCHDCRRKLLNHKLPVGTRMYLQYKADKCCKCGFTGDSCQLDVNHIDGNHKNNDPSNLETVCANCHRLITKLNKHGIYR